MIKILFSLICLTTVFTVFGQQDKQFTHYMYDGMSYNPSTTGFQGVCATMIYRNQWDRVQDAPNTTLFNVQANLQNLKSGKGNVGVGLSVSNDAIGFQRNNNLTLNGAYHLRTVYGVVSAGVGLGFINVGFSPEWVPPSTPADLDPAISSINQKVGQIGFDNNLGVYWYGNRDYYVGLSMTHLAPANLANINFKVARHYYISAGTKYQLKNNLISRNNPFFLRPSILVKADGVNAVFDVNLTADIWIDQNSYFWGGVTYRYSDAVGLMLGYSRNSFKIGYSFDIMTNPLNTYGKGTHELMLSYCLFPKPHGISSHGHSFILE